MSRQENDPTEAPKLKEVFNKKTIKRGILIFIAISLVSFTGIFLYTNTGKTLEIWAQVKWYYIIAGFGFVFNDLFLGALRNQVFIKEFKPGIPLMISVKANLANIFMGAVTPSQSGGGPAQLYIYHRHGVKISDNISNSFFNWISTIVFFPLTGAFAIYVLQDKIPSGFVMHLTKFGFSVFTTLLIVVAIGLFSPQLLGKLINGLGKLLGGKSSSAGKKVLSIGAKATDTMKDYQQRYIGLIKTRPQLMLYSFLLTILLYFNKYALAYVLLLAFGIDAEFWTVIAIQAVLYLLLYFSPSPGGSGIAEISISALMASIVSPEYIASFTLLYRSFLVFIPALLGAIVVLRQISKE